MKNFEHKTGKNITKWLCLESKLFIMHKVLPPLTISFCLSKTLDFAASKRLFFVCLFFFLENKLFSHPRKANGTGTETTHLSRGNLQGFLVPSQVNKASSLAFLDIPFHGKICRWQFFWDIGILLSAFWQIIVKWRQMKGRDEEKGRKHKKKEFSHGGDVFQCR